VRKGELLDAQWTTRLAAPVTLEPALEREFEERVAESARLAFRVAQAVLRDADEAEDVAQECFLRAYHAFSSLRDRERFRGWLVRIAFRCAIDRQRALRTRRRHEAAADREARSTVPSAFDQAARREIQQKVGAAVDELPEKLRVVTLLAALQGHDLREVARLLDLPEGTVKSRLHLARKALARRLADVV